MKYLIVPGLYNSNEKHWQSYFEQVLGNTIRTEQHNWNFPEKEAWVNELRKSMKEIKEDFIIVAHSLGCLTTVHLLQDYAPRRLKGLFLVAPADTEKTNSSVDLTSFNPIPQKPLNYKTLIVAGSNDPWLNINRASDFSYSWNADLLILDNAGHINVNSGFGNWKEGVKLLEAFFG